MKFIKGVFRILINNYYTIWWRGSYGKKKKIGVDRRTTQKSYMRYWSSTGVLKKAEKKEKRTWGKKRIEDLDRLGKILDSEGINYEEAERRLRQI